MKKYIHRLKSGEGKVLFDNFIALSILRLTGYLFPFITLPYLARIIGVNKFGELAFAASVIVFFETFVNFGFDYTATRDIAKNRNNKNLVSKIFSLVMYARFFLLLVSFTLLLFFIWLIPVLSDNRLILILTFLYIPGNILFPEWLFQALERMKYITIINVFSKILFTIFVFFLIKEKEDFIYQPILIAGGYLTSGIFALIIIQRRFSVYFTSVSFSDVWYYSKSSFSMFVSLILPNFYTNFSIIFLTKYCGAEATGLYSSGYKFVGLFDQLMQILSRVFFPFLARRMDKHSIYQKGGIVVSLFASVLMFFSANFLIDIFYTEEFEPAKIIIKIMSVCPFFLFIMNLYGPNYLVLIGKEYILRNIIIFCSIFGMFFTIISIYLYGYVGVSISLTAIWGLRAFLTWFYAKRIKLNL